MYQLYCRRSVCKRHLMRQLITPVEVEEMIRGVAVDENSRDGGGYGVLLMGMSR